MRLVFHMRCHKLPLELPNPSWQLAQTTLAHILGTDEEQLRFLVDGSEAVGLLQDAGSAKLVVEVIGLVFQSPAYHKHMRRARDYARAHPVDGEPPAKKPKVAKAKAIPGKRWDSKFGLGQSAVHIKAVTTSSSSSSSEDSSSLSDASAKWANDGDADGGLSTVLDDATGGQTTVLDDADGGQTTVLDDATGGLSTVLGDAAGCHSTMLGDAAGGQSTMLGDAAGGQSTVLDDAAGCQSTEPDSDDALSVTDDPAPDSDVPESD